MARLKLTYSIDEIKNNQYTFGGEWMTEDAVEYIGLYHTYTTGEVYTRPQWDKILSKKLILYVDTTTEKYKYDKLNSTQLKTYNSVQPYNVIVKADDYDLGYIIRYFCKKRNETLIIEVSESQYEEWELMKIDNILYDMIQIKWFISGPIDDEFGPVTKYGVRTKNIRTIQEADRQMPGLVSYIPNYLQFYSDTDFIVPKDINS